MSERFTKGDWPGGSEPFPNKAESEMIAAAGTTESTSQGREPGAGERARELVRKTLCADCADGVPYSDDRKMSHIIPNPTKRKHRPCKAWFEADVLEKPLAGALAAVRLEVLEQLRGHAFFYGVPCRAKCTCGWENNAMTSYSQAWADWLEHIADGAGERD